MPFVAKLPVSVTGSRPVLIANACAFALASATALAVLYIEHAQYGDRLHNDFPLCFVPVFAMFLIRKPAFSCVFLLLHLVVLARLLSFVPSIADGTYRYSYANDPVFIMVPFLMLSVVCLAVYLTIVFIRGVISALSVKN